MVFITIPLRLRENLICSFTHVGLFLKVSLMDYGKFACFSSIMTNYIYFLLVIFKCRILGILLLLLYVLHITDICSSPQ